MQTFDSHFCIRDIKMEFARGGGEHLVRPFATVLKKRNDDHYLYLTIKYHHENEYKILRIC